MTLVETFCRNLRMILTMKGESYQSLVDLCKKEVSQATIQNMKHPDKCNPTLNNIEKIAKALNIKPKFLIDPNLDYNAMITPAQGFIRRECLLSEVQDYEVREWEKLNAQRVKNIREQQLLEYIERKKKFLD